VKVRAALRQSPFLSLGLAWHAAAELRELEARRQRAKAERQRRLREAHRHLQEAVAAGGRDGERLDEVLVTTWVMRS
jgi:hypothetical protein